MKQPSTDQSILNVDVESALKRTVDPDDCVTGAWRFREEWCLNLYRRLNADLFSPAGFPIPGNIRISCGVPSSGQLPRSTSIAAVTYDPSCSSDGTYEIAVNPLIDNSFQVAAVLGEQFIYVVNGLTQGRDASFKRIAKAVDLNGRAQQMVPGEAVKRITEEIIRKFGPYPHAALQADQNFQDSDQEKSGNASPVSNGPQPQKARLIKASCGKCGLTLRLTRKWIENRLLVCPDAHCAGHRDPLLLEGVLT